MMETEEAAVALAKLGHPIRLRIVQILVQAGEEGLSVGEIQALLDIPGSTLSHHISHLVSGDLIRQQRESRTLRCFVNYKKVEGLVELLTDKCCMGVDLTHIEQAPEKN
ncbi:metalloregulator ArsR/SmtB family transcription factor [uncultured Sneathiella sp.]|jgi:DNA-binding transcriptional ArsR family regulator|uniref:ArsR/SmtB family transcription factor n=1 Tax=uncultured Sneathiella sp. TaxID=879315 RepID=UPI0030DB9ACD|tara:strand:- start:137 stop:463 length:327 start_codon:yes stop_codon:yes gene_type:complete